MMVKPIALANAFTIVGVGLYIGCRALALLVPDLLYSVGQSWFHTLSLNAVRGAQPFNTGTFIFGGIVWAVLVWVTFWAGAYLYNKFAK